MRTHYPPAGTVAHVNAHVQCWSAPCPISARNDICYHSSVIKQKCYVAIAMFAKDNPQCFGIFQNASNDRDGPEFWASGVHANMTVRSVTELLKLRPIKFQRNNNKSMSACNTVEDTVRCVSIKLILQPSPRAKFRPFIPKLKTQTRNLRGFESFLIFFIFLLRLFLPLLISYLHLSLPPLSLFTYPPTLSSISLFYQSFSILLLSPLLSLPLIQPTFGISIYLQ